MPSPLIVIREGIAHRLELSFTARIGTLLVGSVQLSPVRIGRPPRCCLARSPSSRRFATAASAMRLIERALTEAKAKGHRLVVLVGDEPYYGRNGFRRIPKGRVTMPGPVDPARLLACELVEGALDGVSGPIKPDRTAA